MRLDRLAVRILEDVRLRAVQHAGAPALDRRRVLVGVDAIAGSFDAVELDALVVEERVEHADRVGSTADAGHDRVGKPTHLVEQLGAGLFADDLLEVADHRGERVRSRRGAEDVVGGLHRRHPVAIGVVDRVLERART